MTCTDFEILLCDYVDGTLHGEQKSAVEAHLAGCPHCAEMERDARVAVAFLERTAAVEPPPELLTRILYDIHAGRESLPMKPSWVRRVFGKWFEPVLQPRFAMGMAMTVLSFAMLGRFAGIQVRQLKPSDLEPAKVWAAIEDKALRTWDRGVKYYESLRLVYELQTRLKELTDQAEPERGGEPAVTPDRRTGEAQPSEPGENMELPQPTETPSGGRKQ
jgi:hypothetical protein